MNLTDREFNRYLTLWNLAGDRDHREFLEWVVDFIDYHGWDELVPANQVRTAYMIALRHPKLLRIRDGDRCEVYMCLDCGHARQVPLEFLKLECKR